MRGIQGFFVYLSVCSFVSVSVLAKSYWTEKSQTEADKYTVDAKRLNEVFTRLAEKMSPTVVNVYTKTQLIPKNEFGQQARPEDLFRFFFGNPFEDPFRAPGPRQAQSLGSGFVLNKKGYIVTNAHVIRVGNKFADEIMVKFIGGERGRGFPAEVIGVDQSTDVALIKLKKTKADLFPAPLGNSDKIKVGHWVIAIGNPYGHAHTVTQGIVSALGRNVEDLRAEFIQTSASINPGNSGGPLINLSGEVIGINTAIDPRAQGIGFAIPINRAKHIIRQLIEKGKVDRGWIGIGIGDVTPELAEYLKLPVAKGVLVKEIFRGEPADRAGLKVYDVIVRINGKEVASSNTLAIVIGDVPIGSSASLEVFRDGKKENFEIQVGRRKSDEEIMRGQGSRNLQKKADLSEKVGIVLAPLTVDVKRNLALSPSVNGVLVQFVKPYSAAMAAGVRGGDVITEINRVPVKLVDKAEKQIKKIISKKGQLLLKIQRKYGTAVVLLDLGK